MCAKFGCGPTVVSKKEGGGVQTDKVTLQIYIVDNTYMYPIRCVMLACIELYQSIWEIIFKIIDNNLLQNVKF